jgi:hypothetical protein
VCYDPLDLEVGIETTKCGHKYCQGCFDAHMKVDNKCAMCRTVLKEKKPPTIDGEYAMSTYAYTLDPTVHEPSGPVVSPEFAEYMRQQLILLDSDQPTLSLDLGHVTNYEPTGSSNGPHTLNPVYVLPIVRSEETSI